MNSTSYLLNLDEVGLNDLDMVGGKNASLGEMLQNLTKLGINIPGGFVITVDAYREFLRHNDLEETIKGIVNAIDYNDIESLRRGGLQVRTLLKNSKFPKELSENIIEKYYELSKLYDQEETDVAVRSSATAEDLPDAVICRSAGNLFECPWTGFVGKFRKKLFCLIIYRQGHQLSP